MAIFTELEHHVDRLRVLLGDDAVDAAAVVNGLSDDDVAAVIVGAGALARAAERLGIVATGVAARRSSREAGHGGMAQKRGHRNTASLVQELTGSTKADAAKHVRLGESLLDAAVPVVPTATEDEEHVSVDLAEPWHAPLGQALMAGTISSAQHDAILRNLGEPPLAGPGGVKCGPGCPCEPDCASAVGARSSDDAATGTSPEAGAGAAGAATVNTRPSGSATASAGRATTANAGPGETTSGGARAETSVPCACLAAMNATTVEAWRVAAEQLIDEASQRTVEELRRTTRIIRDRLDPDGAERRYLARFEARAFRTWTDADGIHRGSFTFDDLGAAWVRSIIDTALRPRRGGPRFVDPTEKKHADDLANDSRTNDQLAYDLIMDVLRAGALADADTVFGTKQAGVRVVTVTDPTTAEVRTAHLEDTGEVLPLWIADQHACDTCATDVTLDRDGNPLYLGREARLFSSRQRVTLAVRDGGCRIPGCDRPPHYCEAHHIDEYAKGGKTDIDRGILLCVSTT